MGSSSSLQRVKTVYVTVDNAQVSIVFSPNCSTQELKELLASAAGLSRWDTFTIVNGDGSLVAISPSMPANTPSSAYHLNKAPNNNSGDVQVLNEVLTQVSNEFSKAFRIQEFTNEFSSRLQVLERKLEVESLKAVEIEACKREVSKMKDQIALYSPAPMNSSNRSISRIRRNNLPYRKYELSQETVEYLKKPTFDIWNWEPNEMLCLLEHMYHELNLVDTFHINIITLQKWLMEVQENYRNNPFHNFRHCFCVAQMMYGMIHLLNLEDIFSKLELVVLLTAAICHDIDHPGFNNNYQINARTELAIRYNDKSPLENHHCAVTFQVLEKPEHNIFAYVGVDEFKKIRAGIIDLILATDMSRHSEIMESFKQVQPVFDYNDEQHRCLLKQMLIKACDISNEVRPTEIAEPWVDCLLEEYFRQSDREKSEGLPVAPFMDRDKVTKPSAQIGFIKFVLIPLFDSLNRHRHNQGMSMGLQSASVDVGSKPSNITHLRINAQLQIKINNTHKAHFQRNAHQRQ